MLIKILKLLGQMGEYNSHLVLQKFGDLNQMNECDLNKVLARCEEIVGIINSDVSDAYPVFLDDNYQRPEALH